MSFMENKGLGNELKREVPKIASGINNELAHLSDLISEVAQLWSEVEKAISPVLKATDPPVEEKMDRIRPATPLAGELCLQNDRLASLRRNIQSTLEQIDL